MTGPRRTGHVFRDPRDPLFKGIKVTVVPDGTIHLACLQGCRANRPGGPSKVTGREDSMQDAREWAKWHRHIFPLHDTGKLNTNRGKLRRPDPSGQAEGERLIAEFVRRIDEINDR